MLGNRTAVAAAVHECSVESKCAVDVHSRRVDQHKLLISAEVHTSFTQGCAALTSNRWRSVHLTHSGLFSHFRTQLVYDVHRGQVRAPISAHPGLRFHGGHGLPYGSGYKNPGGIEVGFGHVPDDPGSTGSAFPGTD